MAANATATTARAISRTQSTALKDTFGRAHTYLRLSLTEKCNFRCIYCMPEEGVPLTPSTNLLTATEIGRITKIFTNRGITKIRLTGGEPLIRRDIVEIAQSIGVNVKSLGITTNGLLLRRYLNDLIDANVRHFNISLDTLQPKKFELLTRRRGLGQVMDGIERTISNSKSNVKINCVVMRGINDDELESFSKLTEHQEIDVRFIEYMPFSGNKWKENKFISYKSMLSHLQTRFDGSLQRVRDGPNDTCKHWQVPGWKGRIGFITSMTDHFCGTCNRLRVTADGSIKVCLFDNQEISLRDALRNGSNDEDVENLIETAVLRKKFALGGSRDRHEIAQSDNRSMIRIGG